MSKCFLPKLQDRKKNKQDAFSQFNFSIDLAIVQSRKFLILAERLPCLREVKG